MTANGYLIVLESSKDTQPALNKFYRGVDRLPSYPGEIPNELEAIDFYTFSGVRLDSGLIGDYRRAIGLLKLFEKSPRRFEILFCSYGDDATGFEQEENLSFLGVDVASITGDCWSIVGDYPQHNEMRTYLHFLNENGLFRDCEVAQRFLSAYRLLKLADYEFPFEVVNVYKTHEKKPSNVLAPHF